MAPPFCFRWENHLGILKESMNNVLSREVHGDCKLVAEGNILNAHKFVLCAYSPYLDVRLF